MKTKYFVFGFFALAFSLIASAYVPLVREGVKWVYYWDYDNEPNDGVIYHCEYAMEISGDSVVNGVTYKKLYFHPLSEPIGLSEPFALVREENKVVYINSEPYNLPMIDWAAFDWYWYIELNGTTPMVAGETTNEWVLYDFNDVNHPFSNLTTDAIEECGGRYCAIPEYTYSETIELQGESAKVYVADFPTQYLIEGLGYVGLLDMTYPQGWVYTAANVCSAMPIGYPFYYYEFSYLADNEGNVLYKGPAYAKMCDNNYDGKVDGDDLNRLINFVLNGDKPWESYKYDANGDGEVDGADINEVINFILNK